MTTPVCCAVYDVVGDLGEGISERAQISEQGETSRKWQNGWWERAQKMVFHHSYFVLEVGKYDCTGARM